MSTRVVRVSDLSGPAASAVRAARDGTPADVTSRGQVVARIVPVEDEHLVLGGLTVTGTAFRVPRRVARMVTGTITDQLIADRDRP